VAKRTGILLIAHGSPVQQANEDLLAVVGELRTRGRYDLVEPAYLEGASPSIPEGIRSCVEQGAERVVAIPYFLLPGGHVTLDLPAFMEEARTAYPDVEFALGRPLGDHPLLAEVVRERLEGVE